MAVPRLRADRPGARNGHAGSGPLWFLHAMPGFEHTLLLAFTEQNTRAEIDQLVHALGELTT